MGGEHAKPFDKELTGQKQNTSKETLSRNDKFIDMTSELDPRQNQSQLHSACETGMLVPSENGADVRKADKNEKKKNKVLKPGGKMFRSQKHDEEDESETEHEEAPAARR